jgi:hypothetical protein
MQLPRSASLKRMQWTAVILCAAAIAINYLDRWTIAIANPQIRAEFHMSAVQFGALQSAWSLAYALAQIPVGLLIDRLGPGILLGISMILWSIAVAAGGLVANYSNRASAQIAGGARLSGIGFIHGIRCTFNCTRTRNPMDLPCDVFSILCRGGEVDVDNSCFPARLLRVLFQHPELRLLSRGCLLSSSHGANR